MSAIDTGSQVVVVRYGERSIGLLVSELPNVARFDPAHIVATPMAGRGSGMLVKQLINANQRRLLVQVVDRDCLFGMLIEPDAGDGVGVRMDQLASVSRHVKLRDGGLVREQSRPWRQMQSTR